MTQCIVSLIGSIVLLAGLNLLAGIGFLVRQGVVTKKGLSRVKTEAASRGIGINRQKYDEVNMTANLKIYGPILGALGLYTVIFFLDMSFFLVSLLGLIPIFLGYFGIFWRPDVD